MVKLVMGPAGLMTRPRTAMAGGSVVPRIVSARSGVTTSMEGRQVADWMSSCLQPSTGSQESMVISWDLV